jgi:hypothetical protein
MNHQWRQTAHDYYTDRYVCEVCGAGKQSVSARIGDKPKITYVAKDGEVLAKRPECIPLNDKAPD